MSWFEWFLVALHTAGALLTVLDAGKPREPVSHEVAAFTVIVAGLVIAGIFRFGVEG